MASILPQIKHIVVVMLENRSFDNVCGGAYAGLNEQPSLFLPAGSPPVYDGLNSGLWNPSNIGFFAGQPPVKVPVVPGTTANTMPDPDPEETFDNVTFQLYGPEQPGPSPSFPMQGFVVNYENTGSAAAHEIMQTYTASQVPVITSLAREFAVSDAWFCSVPSQTWPNRAFVHAGTSNGNVNNGTVPNPFHWNLTTIFNVLNSIGASWKVYNDDFAPSLTRLMFPRLWEISLNGHFRGFDAFQDDCASDSLPQYSFLEPDFLTARANDEHPPHDVSASERFLAAVWQAVSGSPAWTSTLLLITYDEHGGCFDHVLPPSNAMCPDPASNPGHEGFSFDRFGVRVPAVVVSPFIDRGTVFRSPTETPYDHTSVLATLRDWLAIPVAKMLKSQRIATAPTLEHVLTLASPRTDLPLITPAPRVSTPTDLSLPPNDLQVSMVAAAAQFKGLNAVAELAKIRTRQDVLDFCNREFPWTGDGSP
jgi:phospholipase C